MEGWTRRLLQNEWNHPLEVDFQQAMDRVAKEVFLVQTGGGDVEIQGIPLVALEGQRPRQGGLGPQPKAQRDTSFNFSP
ncbi:hypothetical protein DUI87_10955 [Hirundo rustica rustica]|uniref:Uncharacterized protein n=1 Tax=Hirundo rustica rustica TaxID=333673 RepID=A0A3M0L298_HIRRU|nr:hypothetical protein DUI87_10955 [Hirundo rustica rustica]